MNGVNNYCDIKNNNELNNKKYINSHNEFYTQNNIFTRKIINDPIEEVEEAKEDSEMPNISTENKIFKISSNHKNSQSQDANKKIKAINIRDKIQINRKNLLRDNIISNLSYNGHYSKYISFKNKINNKNIKKSINLKQYIKDQINDDNNNLSVPIEKSEKARIFFMKNNKILKNNNLADNNKNEMDVCDANSSRSSGIHTLKEKFSSNTNTTTNSKTSISNNNLFEKRKKRIKEENLDKNVDQTRNLKKSNIFKKLINRIHINKDDVNLFTKIEKYQSFKSLDRKHVKNFEQKSSKSITKSTEKEKSFNKKNKSSHNKRYLTSRFRLNEYLSDINLK